MNPDFIQTNRLIFRPLVKSDASNLFALDSNPAVMRFLGNRPVQSIENVHIYLENVLHQYTLNDIGRWAVLEKETGLFVGWAGLKFIDKTTNGYINFYDIGYRLKPEFWGKGYATEATNSWIDYAKKTMHLKALFAITHINNLASQNVLQKCGFERKNRFTDTVYDVQCYWWHLLLKK